MEACVYHAHYFYLFTLFRRIGRPMNAQHFREILESVQLSTHSTQGKIADEIMLSNETLRKYKHYGVSNTKAPVVVNRLKDYLFKNIAKENKMSELNYLNEEIALKSIINQALYIFPKSFINRSNEIILEPKNNLYFRLEDVNTELDFKCKMFAWVSRPIAKSLNKYWSSKVLRSFNELLGTNFTKDEMYKIYDRLGNDVNRKLTVRFIESNYDLSILERHIV